MKTDPSASNAPRLSRPDRLAPLKAIVRRMIVLSRWLFKEVPHDPIFELFARQRDMINRRTNKAARAVGPTETLQGLKMFVPSVMPRILWMYWDKGEADAPFVVRRAIESWRRHNPTWDIRVLTAENVNQHIDMTDFPKTLPARYFANLLRLRLLKAYGGVWVDVTVYCHRPLDSWLPLHATSGFFAFNRPGPDRLLSSWFLYAQKDNPIVIAWAAEYWRYLRRLAYKADKYFMFFYTLEWALRRNRSARTAWERAAKLPAQSAFFMMYALTDDTAAADLHKLLQAGQPVSKLNHKVQIDPTAFDTLCESLPKVV